MTLKLTAIAPEILNEFRIARRDRLIDIYTDAAAARESFPMQGLSCA